MSNRWACLVVWLAAAAPGWAEPADGTALVKVRSGVAPVAGAEIIVEGMSFSADARGEARFPLAAGAHRLSVMHPGFETAAASIVIRAGEQTTLVVPLREASFEETVTVVSATRSGTIVQDEPIRVESVPGEEIEENLTTAPGSLTTLLTELPGVQFQTLSASLGGAGLRLRGLSDRYVQVLVDDLPLFGQRPDAFSLLQVPPLDLGRVEVIKGSASALYGGAALGGILNLVSRRPGAEPEALVNITSRSGADAVGFVPFALGHGWGLTVLGALDRQVRQDTDGDGWTDLPGARRAVLRPRFYWSDDAGRSVFLTVGAMTERREGGTVAGAASPSGAPFVDTRDTRRADAGLVARLPAWGDRLITVRAAVTRTSAERDFAGQTDEAARLYGLAEASIGGTTGGHTWLGGAAVEYDRFHSRDLSRFDYTRTVPGLFVQDEWTVAEPLVLAGAVRADLQPEFGTFWAARASALLRPGAGWSVRLSTGSGRSAPTPFTDETEVVGLWRFLPLRDVQPERAWTRSLDVEWARGHFEASGSLFQSGVDLPLVERASATSPGAFEIVNASGPNRAWGTELLLRWSRGRWHAIANHTFIRATEENAAGGGRVEARLTPRYTAELAVLWEDEKKGRAGVEVSWTGAQRLDDDPYRTWGAAFTEVNLLAEARIGSARAFVNCTNLTDVRQKDFEPIVLPEQAPDGRWTVKPWAPLAGRTFNAGLRWEF